MSAQSAAQESYDELLDRIERISNLYQAAGVLHWDQQVMMPEGGTPARSKQLSAVSAVRHDLLTDEDLGRLLDDLDGGTSDDSDGATTASTTTDDVPLNAEQRAVVREVRREHERAADVPGDLVEELAETRADAQKTWQDAKAESDFEAFAPTLRKLRDLHVERAGHVDPDAHPYRVLFEDNEPYLPLETVNRVLDRLREELGALVEQVRASDADLAAPFADEYPEDEQMALCEDALDVLGYDWDRGRLDTSPHPFSTGNQFDARVTTRFKPEDPVDALMSTIHEFGHATYQLGLRQDAYGTPLGQPRSHGVHESQSRFWENHVGRSRAFWELFLPTMQERFPRLEDVTVEDAYQAVNRIYPDNLVRVEADELTYHFHIILRAEIERDLVEGDLDVAEIPAVWNDKMEAYLGVRPETDAEGCLQDIHWTSGFARFQNYTVGSVLAAQLHAAIEDDLGPLDEYVREGDFEPIREWLTEHVHRHGQRYTTDELVEVATGEPLTADYFLDYANEKFGELYGI